VGVAELARSSTFSMLRHPVEETGGKGGDAKTAREPSHVNLCQEESTKSSGAGAIFRNPYFYPETIRRGLRSFKRGKHQIVYRRKGWSSLRVGLKKRKHKVQRGGWGTSGAGGWTTGGII